MILDVLGKMIGKPDKEVIEVNAREEARLEQLIAEFRKLVKERDGDRERPE